MRFIADKQTLDDLNLSGKFKSHSVYQLFNRVITDGGAKVLDEMFEQPFVNETEINIRSSIFKYFTGKGIKFPFNKEDFNLVENYLSSGDGVNLPDIAVKIISKRVLNKMAQDEGYQMLKNEIGQTIKLLSAFSDFANLLSNDDDSPYQKELLRIKEIFNHKKLQWLIDERDAKEISLVKLIKYDFLLRIQLREEMQKLTRVIFYLDVYIAIASIAAERGFCYAQALPKADNILEVDGLFHPSVKNAVGNSVLLNEDKNMFFLTGANMAGKSTLMKALGIAVYLAHMGFPIAANRMSFSVKDGVFSSINVSDNLSLGYSHFYAEVLRVKKVAEEVASSKDLYVIFDELFKGTNVKDAYDGTFAITEAFSENRNCFFIISTHIVEVGETLKEQYDNFNFVYLPTVMDGKIPKYTYDLKDGITTDRQGMMIVENEGLLDIIRGRKSKS